MVSASQKTPETHPNLIAVAAVQNMSCQQRVLNIGPAGSDLPNVFLNEENIENFNIPDVSRIIFGYLWYKVSRKTLTRCQEQKRIYFT
jgi:hypothetical protein